MSVMKVKKVRRLARRCEACYLRLKKSEEVLCTPCLNEVLNDHIRVSRNPPNNFSALKKIAEQGSG